MQIIVYKLCTPFWLEIFYKLTNWFKQAEWGKSQLLQIPASSSLILHCSDINLSYIRHWIIKAARENGLLLIIFQKANNLSRPGWVSVHYISIQSRKCFSKPEEKEEECSCLQFLFNCSHTILRLEIHSPNTVNVVQIICINWLENILYWLAQNSQSQSLLIEHTNGTIPLYIFYNSPHCCVLVWSAFHKKTFEMLQGSENQFYSN